ncbi:MAG: outer membrane protein assembly factor [Pseudomonadales bacterium]|nr:outer membrane protein assembly factor [Pseudomonadales bacterium]MCP5329860.1 outer membrane protein assembly factor [Pseudomonadales bacterium]
MPGVFAHKTLLPLALVAITQTGVAQPPAPTLHISGADARLEENIRAHLRLLLTERCETEVRRLNRLLPQVARDVERAAQALGYYRSQQQASFTRNENCWELGISITPGEPVLLGEVHVQVTPDTTRSLQQADPFATLRGAAGLRTGQPLIHSDYEALKSALSAVAVENGYFAARFTRSQLQVDVSQKRADVFIDFDPGERFRFGEIRITPIEALSQAFISRFVPFEQGTPYSTDALIALRDSLNNSLYFSAVAVTPQLDASTSAQARREVPVSIDLAMRPRRSWSTGLGVTTDIGPRVTLAYEDRYLNRSGHRFNSDMALSPLDQRANLSYNLPMRNPGRESLNFSTGYVGQDTDTYTTDTFKIGVSYRSTVDAWVFGADWLQNIFSNYQRERSIINDNTERSNLTINGINWTKTVADDPIFPHRGWRLFAQLSGASNAVLSDLSFVQLYASGKYVHDFGPGRLLLRSELATSVVDGVEDLPVSIRYFTGGDQSVRGYQYGSLGATNDDGEVVGGKHLLTASVEYDFQVLPSWRGAVFYDTGNSFADYTNLALKASAGLGVRWQSPIGPIRADVARALDGSGYRLHVTMGPDL